MFGSQMVWFCSRKHFLKTQTVDLSLHVGTLLTVNIGSIGPWESSLGFILSMIRVTGGYEQVKEGIGLVLFIFIFIHPPPPLNKTCFKRITGCFIGNRTEVVMELAKKGIRDVCVCRD